MSNTTTPQDYYVSAYSGEEHDEAVGKALGAVRYDAAQTLTAAQQHTAQKNIGTTWPCNPNLLDNWCFLPGFVVNQRGQTSYSGAGYGIDRWFNETTATVVLTEDGLSVTGAQVTVQKIPRDFYEQIRGNVFTVSILFSDNTLETSSGVWDNTHPIVTAFQGGNFRCQAFDEANVFETGRLETNSTFTKSIVAVKLELGDQQTLAHQDADGNWVLNEIPNYAELLARCQRYAVELNAHDLEYPMIGIGQARLSTRISLVLPMAAMRAVPTIQTDWAKWSCANQNTFLPVSSGIVNADGAGAIQLFLNVSGATPGAVYEVGMSGYGKALLTAEL